MLRRLSIIITAAIFWQIGSSVSLAKSNDPEQADKFPPSPLEVTTPDPLLPALRDKQGLTPAEQQKLEVALDDLNQQATAQLQAGDKEKAFEIWNRELRLRRYLGTMAEITALTRVGEIAWNESDRQEIFYITQRLQGIQKQPQPQKKNVQTQVDLGLLQALGQAYQKVRSLQGGIEVYNQVLATVRQQGNLVGEIETLQILGEIHLSWFNYSQAADRYQELLKLATARGGREDEVTYLQKLAYIYEQGKQPQQLIDVLNQLKGIYSQDNNFTQLPALQMAIAANYETLAKENPSLLQEAFKNYQDAYSTAWELEQYTRAGEAIQKLIGLYRSQGQIQEALQASEIWLEIDARGSNYYGLMQAYDQIGQLYLEEKQYPQALTAFENGLELAKRLKHQEAYFNQQIEKVAKMR